MTHHAAICQIHSAPLTAAPKLAAVALLAHAQPGTGSVVVSWEDALSLLATKTHNAAKNRLSALKRAGLITYTTGGGMVSLAFTAWAGAESSPAQVTIVTPTGDNRNQSQAAKNGLSPVEVTIVTSTGDNCNQIPPTPPRVSEYTDPIQNTGDSLTPVTTPEPKPEPQPLTDEQARTLAMLSSLGIIEADRLVRRHGFERCRNHALVWMIERAEKPELSAGVLVWRIEHAKTPLAPKVAPHDVQEFKRTWPTETEAAETARWAGLSMPWTVAGEEGEEDDEPQANEKPEGDDAPRLDTSAIVDDPTWAKALAELSLQMTPATYDAWVKDAALASLDLETGRAVIAAPTDSARDWLDSRLGPTVRRTLGGILKHSVHVQFVTASA